MTSSSWWVLLLLLQVIEALNYTDFGLPNRNTCAFSYNETLYIFGQDNNVSITFGNPWDKSTPNITNLSQYKGREDINTTDCAITESGQIILIQQQRLQTLDVDTLKPNRNITLSLQQTYFASTTFNDYYVIFGGLNSSLQPLQSTLILDTRYPSILPLYELPVTQNTPPPSAYTSLASTSRWILHFRTQFIPSNRNYTVFIDCFDPLTFSWMGTIANFTSVSDHIQAVGGIKGDLDSLLLIPAWSNNGSNSRNISSNSTATLYQLYINTYYPPTITSLTPISSTTSLSKRDNVGLNPVLGGSVTRVGNDLAVWYGGTDQQMLFFNTSSLNFMPNPTWLSTTQPTASPSPSPSPRPSENKNSTDGGYNKNLAIILGTVIGGVIFIALVVLLLFCCISKKRRQQRLRGHHMGENEATNKATVTREKKGVLTLPLLKLLHHNNDLAVNNNSTSPVDQLENNYIITPIKPSTPISVSLPSGEPSTSSAAAAAVADNTTTRKTSRFREHF